MPRVFDNIEEQLDETQWNPCCQVDPVNGKHAPVGPNGRSERISGD